MKVTMRVMMIMCLIRVMLLVKNKVIMMGYLLHEIGKNFCKSWNIFCSCCIYCK